MQKKKSLTFSAGNMFCGKTNPIKVFHLVLFICINNQIAQIYFVRYTVTQKHSGFWLLFLLIGASMVAAQIFSPKGIRTM